MVPQSALREKLRPARHSKERGRTRGVVRELLAFKADLPTVQYVENEAAQEGWSVTTVLHDMVTTQVALEKELGQKWLDIEAEAIRLRTHKGKVLADLVLKGLRAK